MKNYESLVAALKAANAPVFYGLGGISMEEQRLAVRLARKMGASVSVQRPLLATLTLAALNTIPLILTAGGELPAEAAATSRVIKDDRLLTVEAWRALSALAKGNKLPGTDAYASLYEEMKAERAALVLVTDSVDEVLRRAINRFTQSHKLEVMQVPSMENALGAYEVMLEEAGSENAWFGGDQLHCGNGYGLSCTANGSCDLLVRIGEGCAPCCSVPAYAIAPAAKDGETLVEAGTAGGTAMRYDFVPVKMDAAGARTSILSLLAQLMEEV
ncbi:MAG: hypothetical protein IKU12_06555 [Oscillospiraceae bacterium]|nr:hypothetical protein [Oscillospiraceae bacterium]